MNSGKCHPPYLVKISTSISSLQHYQVNFLLCIMKKEAVKKLSFLLLLNKSNYFLILTLSAKNKCKLEYLFNELASFFIKSQELL